MPLKNMATKLFLKEVSYALLFNKKYSKTVILWKIITIWNNCFLYEYEMPDAITPVFSVTWSFKKSL